MEDTTVSSYGRTFVEEEFDAEFTMQYARDRAVALIVRALTDICDMHKRMSEPETTKHGGKNYVRETAIRNGEDAIRWIREMDRGAISFRLCCDILDYGDADLVCQRLLSDPDGVLNHYHRENSRGARLGSDDPDSYNLAESGEDIAGILRAAEIDYQTTESGACRPAFRC